MQSFSKHISVDLGYTAEFLFNRIFTGNGIRYHVSVITYNSESYFFNMEQSKSGWKIINAPKLPDWIIAVEKNLEDAIIENSHNKPN